MPVDHHDYNIRKNSFSMAQAKINCALICRDATSGVRPAPAGVRAGGDPEALRAAGGSAPGAAAGPRPDRPPRGRAGRVPRTRGWGAGVGQEG